VITLANPALSTLLLTLFLGIALATSGIMRIASSVQLEPRSGWGWLMASGVITFLLGAIFILGWPLNSIWLLGMMLSIDLTFQGVALFAFGVALGIGSLAAAAFMIRDAGVRGKTFRSSNRVR
jgi:uncharacterized membrane protein HdeD (DUF308 family)